VQLLVNLGNDGVMNKLKKSMFGDGSVKKLGVLLLTSKYETSLLWAGLT